LLEAPPRAAELAGRPAHGAGTLLYSHRHDSNMTFVVSGEEAIAAFE
jgi:hypothetical protein